MTIIAEEVLLLAYEETEGKQLVTSAYLDSAIGGALLAELALNGRIALDGKKVVVKDAGPLGNEELDAALTRIAEDAKERRPESWVYKLQSGKLRKRLLTGLAERGVLGENHRKILGIFPSSRYPELDPSVELEVRGRVQSVLDGAEPDERTIMLIAVLRAAKIDRKAFPGVDKKRVKELTEDVWVGKAVAKHIASMHAATTGGAVAAVS
ncbi:GOLPH3/VPS74 family protein [Planobispora longispora]|uniref:GPP34 family phosphoprotein n=1 Tax=Planobispora longispora TaxID=28887 RepID=A0A8J3W4C4_9ACTN|nr:GPP34 family phosphoprotein [Planobispora longispora]BFE85087.1 hypothetical protein GCM10020093_076880 [Planobispora longispora]GIH75228.1 hypothetical protein Plo01_16570 [Planobispora longispora]